MLKIFYILPFFFLVDAESNQTNLSRKLQPRIWNGFSTTDRRVFPFYVGVYALGSGHCGGTLISKYFVLTAAQCVTIFDSDGNWEPAIVVRLAFGMSKFYAVDSEDTDSYFMKVYREGIIIHPLYNSSTKFNDIALIRLPYEANLTRYVQLAYLPIRNEFRGFQVGQELFSSGWGFMGDDENKEPTKLQYMITKIVSENECIHPTINQFDDDKNICINAANRSVCRGDSGGPNVIFTNRQAILIGISSHLTTPSSEDEDFNHTCEAGLPQVLTRGYDAIFGAMRWVDTMQLLLPAFGHPTKPTSAINFKSNVIVLESPGFPRNDVAVQPPIPPPATIHLEFSSFKSPKSLPVSS